MIGISELLKLVKLVDKITAQILWKLNAFRFNPGIFLFSLISFKYIIK